MSPASKAFMDEQIEKKRIRELEQKRARDEEQYGARRRQAVSRPSGGRRDSVRDVEESGDNVFEKAYFELLRWFETIRTAHIKSFPGSDAGSVLYTHSSGRRSSSGSGEESSHASENGQEHRPSPRGPTVILVKDRVTLEMILTRFGNL